MYDYWPRKKKTWKTKLAVSLLLVIAFFSGIIMGNFFSGEKAVVYNVTVPQKTGITMSFDYERLLNTNASSTVTVRIPAVDKDDTGVVTLMTVQVLPGSGRILTNIDRLLFWVDTQNSIRRATMVAENVTGKNMSNYDIVYTITANASVIGGPSAGAAITIATIAAIENKTINHSVMITGSVNHDGTIGPVGGIFEKAVASKDVGAQTLLVPLTQSVQVVYKTREYCEKIGWTDFCTSETYPIKIDIERDVGIDVEEVIDIWEAAEYMIIEK